MKNLSRDAKQIIAIWASVFVLIAASWFALTVYQNTPASGATQPFDHSNCQYPDRWSNPEDGCDNSDPAVPECIKEMYSQAAEQQCIDAFVKAHTEPKKTDTKKTAPVSSSSKPAAVSTCSGK